MDIIESIARNGEAVRHATLFLEYSFVLKMENIDMNGSH